MNVGIGSRYEYISQSTPSLWWRTIALLDRQSEQPESFVFDVDEVFSDSYERCLKTGGLIDISPDFYDLWLRCQLEAVEECDDQFDSPVEDAWNEVLSDGIKIMKSMY